MLLVEFFNTPEGDSYAKSTSTSPITETKRKISETSDPCWKGYHMVGTKSKGGKQVPNCVPKENVAESNPVDAIKMDIPLFIRMMEYAREDAQTDMDLHSVTEKLVALSKTNQTLTMQDYEKVVGN